MAERLTPRTPDLEVRGSSLARRVVSLDKEFHSPLSPFTQVYKWVPATYCRGGGGNPTMDQHPVQGGLALLLGMLHAKETGISSGLLCAFNLPLYNVTIMNVYMHVFIDFC